MELLTNFAQQQPEVAAFAMVVFGAAIIAFSAREFGKLTMADLSVGPINLVSSALAMSAIYAVLIGGVIALLGSTMQPLGVAIPIGVVAATVAFLNGFSPAYDMSVKGHAVVEERKSEGRRVAALAIPLFAKLDLRKSGALTEDDLLAASRRTDLSASERAVVAYLYNNAERIGFVCDRSVRHDRVVVGSISSGYAVNVPEVVEHFSITLENLNDYPHRLDELYRLWK